MPDVANQKRILEQECQQQHIEVNEWIMEIGGGMNFQRKQFLRLVDQILAGEVERLVLARPRSVGTFCLFAVGSSLAEPPVRVAGHEYGRTQPRARVGPGADHHCPLFQFACVRVTKLPESLRESYSR